MAVRLRHRRCKEPMQTTVIQPPMPTSADRHAPRGAPHEAARQTRARSGRTDLRPAFHGALLGAVGASLLVSSPLVLGLFVAATSGEVRGTDWLSLLGTVFARAFLGGYGLAGGALGAWLAHRWARVRVQEVMDDPQEPAVAALDGSATGSSRELKFACLQCDQRIACPSEWVGREIRCPSCLEAIAVPPPPGPAGERWRSRNTATASGATLSLALTGAAWATILLSWAWVFTRPPGTFNDQGGMVITFLILPLTLVGWLVGGPFASALAHRVRRQVGTTASLQRAGSIARAAAFLARMLTWTGIAVVGYVLVREFTR